MQLECCSFKITQQKQVHRQHPTLVNVNSGDIAASFLIKFAKFQQPSVEIRSNQNRLVQWYGKSCPKGPIKLTGQQSAGQTSCPWTCMRGRLPPRGPACSSLSHGYPVCKRSGVGCSPHYPHSSAMPSH